MTLLLILALVGCSSQSAPPTAEAEHDEHAHESGGPHGGAIIELGEYHAELVHDDAAGTVTVYVLDGALAKNVPVDAKEATINITREGGGKQFSLSASPVEGELEGWSSRFVSSDPELGKELDHPGAAAVFVVSINGKQHRGFVAHDHDHEHDHDHAEEEEGADHSHE
jgi:hypothetical protein